MSASYHLQKDLDSNQLAGFKVNVTFLHTCCRCFQFPDVFSFSNACATDSQVKEMSIFIACFYFRRVCISPHPQAALANALSPIRLDFGIEPLLLDVFIVNTFLVA